MVFAIHSQKTYFCFVLEETTGLICFKENKTELKI